ncbi:MAG TPA: hypothetical protein EYN73_02145 [Chromatiaceae bacterium]|nr:hypothetical protein [Chromatiaceae bacterium]
MADQHAAAMKAQQEAQAAYFARMDAPRQEMMKQQQEQMAAMQARRDEMMAKMEEMRAESMARHTASFQQAAVTTEAK